MSDPLYPQPPVDHSVKIPHLVFGLLFLGIAAVWALVASEAIDADRLPVLAPAVLIVAGVIGLAVSLASGRNSRRGIPARGLDHSGYDSTTPDSRNSHTDDHAATDGDEHTEEIR